MSVVTLHREAREFLAWSLDGIDESTQLEVTFDLGQSWHHISGPVNGEVTLLVAGPLAEDNPNDTFVLPVGRSALWIRAIDNPETVIRPVGVVKIL